MVDVVILYGITAGVVSEEYSFLITRYCVGVVYGVTCGLVQAYTCPSVVLYGIAGYGVLVGVVEFHSYIVTSYNIICYVTVI